MQIGTRWPDHTPPPSSVPSALADAIKAAQVRGGSWTLTWLEGRPIADHSDGTHLELNPEGAVTDRGDELFDEDDDWLS